MPGPGASGDTTSVPKGYFSMQVLAQTGIVSYEWNSFISALGQLCKTSSGNVSQGLNYCGKAGDCSSSYPGDGVVGAETSLL